MLEVVYTGKKSSEIHFLQKEILDLSEKYSKLLKKFQDLKDKD
jgi:hypothetical protein